MKNILLISLMLGLSIIKVNANHIPTGIVSAISAGDAAELSAYFDKTIELTIFEQEEIYSKMQAQMILKDFFENNQPVSFKLIHQGGKESSQYAIGILKTKDKSFRITFLIKSSDNDPYIHQLRIQNEN